MTISLFILAGCGVQETQGVQESFTVPGTPRPLSCEIFTEFPWQEFSFGVDLPADVSSLAVNSWGIEQDQFRFTNLYRDKLSVEWSGSHGRREVNYSALFGVERQLERIDVTWNPPATLAQVIDCLGDPDLYNAHYGPSHHEALLELALWYADEGIFVTHDSYTINLRRTPFRPAQQIDGFALVDPRSPGRALPSLLPSMGYADSDNPGIQAYMLCLLRPWPGSIEAAEATGADSYDDNTRCKTLTYW